MRPTTTPTHLMWPSLPTESQPPNLGGGTIGNFQNEIFLVKYTRRSVKILKRF